MPAAKHPTPRVPWKGAIRFGLVHIPAAKRAAREPAAKRRAA